MYENYDKENMFASIWNFPNNLKDAITLGDGIDLKNDYSHINNIVIAGMGGSAIGGDIVSVLEKDMFAPKYSNILSVWSLDIDFSIIFVSPLAPKLANKIADFTWALATGIL